MDAANKVIAIKDLNFSYEGEMILRDINFDLCKGDFAAVIGPNGGGKTTLMRLILGLLKPDSGSIRLFGQSIAQGIRRVGYVPQIININRDFPINVLDVVLMGKASRGLRRRYAKADREKAAEALETMGVAGFARQRVGSLSGGQRQRVFIARALMDQPELLILDEPTASIDRDGQEALYCLLDQLNTNITILVVSHDLLAISTHIKSIACVNRCLHYHNGNELTPDLLAVMYPGQAVGHCPVEVLAHGLPHRVLADHNCNTCECDAHVEKRSRP